MAYNLVKITGYNGVGCGETVPHQLYRTISIKELLKNGAAAPLPDETGYEILVDHDLFNAIGEIFFDTNEREFYTIIENPKSYYCINKETSTDMFERDHIYYINPIGGVIITGCIALSKELIDESINCHAMQMVLKKNGNMIIETETDNTFTVFNGKIYKLGTNSADDDITKYSEVFGDLFGGIIDPNSFTFYLPSKSKEE